MPLPAPGGMSDTSRPGFGTSRIGWGIIKTVREEAADLGLLGIRLGGQLGLSVGNRGNSILPTRAFLPGVVAEPPVGFAGDVLPPIDRRDTTQDEEVLPVIVILPDGRYQITHPALRGGEPTILTRAGARAVARDLGLQMPTSTPTSTPTVVTTPPIAPGGDDMDLGTLAVDLLRTAGTAYIERELGPRTGGYPTVQPAFLQPDLPFIDIVPDGHRCKRRRRRPIVTPSEISQLASLKAIASPAEVKLFLAKRLRN